MIRDHINTVHVNFQGFLIYNKIQITLSDKQYLLFSGLDYWTHINLLQNILLCCSWSLCLASSLGMRLHCNSTTCTKLFSNTSVLLSCFGNACYHFNTTFPTELWQCTMIQCSVCGMSLEWQGLEQLDLSKVPLVCLCKVATLLQTKKEDRDTCNTPCDPVCDISN